MPAVLPLANSIYFSRNSWRKDIKLLSAILYLNTWIKITKIFSEYTYTNIIQYP